MIAHGGSGRSDTGSSIILLLIALIAAMWAVSRYRPMVSWIWVHINLFEVSIISLFDDSAVVVKQWIESQPKTAWSYEQMDRLADYTGAYIRWPFALLLGLGGIYALRTSPRFRFRRRLTMEQVLAESAITFPAMRPIANRKKSLLDEPLTTGPWRMAQHPIEFVIERGLLVYAADMSKRVTSRIYDINDVIPDRTRIKEEFIAQLGGRFEPDLSDLHQYERALFAVFAARGLGDKSAADKLLAQMATSFREPDPKKKRPGIIDCRGGDALLSKYLDKPEVQAVIERHAFRNTLLTGMLAFARRKGVMTSADFIWLRPTNRHLWMGLNNLGGQTAPVEAAGLFAHYQGETLARSRIYNPDIDRAVDALLRYLVDAKQLSYKASRKALPTE